MLNSTTAKALTIITELELGNEINRYNNADLLKIYEMESEVAADIEEILKYRNLKLYQGAEGELFLSPGVDNVIYGYKNEELRNILRVSSNKELYMCYFIMYTLLTMFFKDDSGRLIKEYISLEDLIEEVDFGLNMLKGDTEEVLSTDQLENEEGCIALVDLWFNVISEVDIKSTKDVAMDNRSTSKIGFANKVLMFFSEMGLIKYDPNTRRYFPLDRLKELSYQVYKDSRYMEVLNRKLNRNKLQGGEEL